MTTTAIQTTPMQATYAPPPPAQRSEKASALAMRLAHAENALLMLTSGQVDAIVDPGGKTYLLHPAQQQLKDSESRLQAILESTADVITVVDRGGKILSQSQAVTRVLGYESDGLVGSSIFELVHEDDLPRMYSAFFNVIEGFEENAMTHFRHRAYDGSYRRIEAAVGKLLNNSSSNVIFSLRPGFTPLAGRDFTSKACPEFIYRREITNKLIEELRPHISLEDQVILIALDGMDDISFDPLSLFYRERLSYQQISEVLEVSVDTVTSRMSQGEGMVRGQLKEFQTDTGFNEGKQKADTASSIVDKDRFLAMLSHELRTPLTPVLLALHELLEDERFAEAEPIFAMMKRNVVLQSRLLEELTDFATVDQHKVRLHTEPVDAHEAIRFVLEICHNEISAAQIDIQLNLRASEPIVMADSARLQQVMWNLVKNAVKFSPSGGSLSITTANALRGRLTIEFTDHGIGIEPHFLPLVFNPFQQGDSKLYGGLGLGMYIARGMAEAQQGTLTATSKGRGEGATFRLTLNNVEISE